MNKRFWLSRTVGGVLAGVAMAGAGAGVAIAGASGTSDQYTKGAKPYAGVQPHDVTVGTQTFPSSVTTTIANPTVTESSTVTVPYDVAVTPTSVSDELAAAVAALTSNAATINALLKPDMRNLLEPTGRDLRIPTLARAKSVSFAFVSPGSGKLTVAWKLAVKGRKSAYVVNYFGTLRRTGDITIKLPTTVAGRKLLSGARNASISAVVTYTAATGGSVKVTRTYKLQG